MISMAEDGASDVEMIAYLDISKDLWYRWIEEEEEFSNTIKRCHALCEAWWTRHGRQMATGIADGNATVWIFNMKNRFKWRDKIEQDITSSDGSMSPTTIELVGVKAK
jgi:hypothetical protein